MRSAWSLKVMEPGGEEISPRGCSLARLKSRRPALIESPNSRHGRLGRECRAGGNHRCTPIHTDGSEEHRVDRYIRSSVWPKSELWGQHEL